MAMNSKNRLLKEMTWIQRDWMTQCYFWEGGESSNNGFCMAMDSKAMLGSFGETIYIQMNRLLASWRDKPRSSGDATCFLEKEIMTGRLI